MGEYKQVNFWGNIKQIWNTQDYKLTQKQEVIELIAYSLISFFIPLVFKQPQILVGTIVNAMLILAALNMKGWKILPMIVLPSIAVAAGGYLFGGFTAYLIYLIPFIWIGNILLVLAFKYFKIKHDKNFAVTLGISALAKAGFLFGITVLLVSFSIIPAIFLTSMGILQFGTTLTGSLLAFAVQNVKKTIF